MPNATSYVVAPDDVHVSVGLTLTPDAVSAGEGDAGVPGTVPPLPVVIASESNVDVLRVDVSWLLTIMPASTVAGNVIVVVPTWVHVLPSADT